MHRGLVVGGGAAVVVFVGALLLVRRDPPASAPSSVDAPHRAEPPAPRHNDLAAPPPPHPRSPGLQLGEVHGPEARSKAQAILDDTLAELRRLDSSHQHLARDVYMRGHSAAERVEDELDEGDEPGLAQLRADEDAMKAELRRIYRVPELTDAP